MPRVAALANLVKNAVIIRTKAVVTRAVRAAPASARPLILGVIGWRALSAEAIPVGVNGASASLAGSLGAQQTPLVVATTVAVSTKWIFATLLGVVGATLTLQREMHQVETKLTDKITGVETKLTDRITGVENELHRVEIKLTEKITGLSERITGVEGEMREVKHQLVGVNAQLGTIVKTLDAMSAATHEAPEPRPR